MSAPLFSAEALIAALGPLVLSIKLGLTVTALLLLLATPLAWWLSQTRSKLRPVIETLTALPLVLPPTVLGFYLLILFAPDAPLGSAFAALTASEPNGFGALPEDAGTVKAVHVVKGDRVNPGEVLIEIGS